MFYKIVERLLKLYFKLFFKLEINNLENLPKEGKLIICSNHISNYDPMVLIASFPRQINWMAKKELFESKIIAYFLEKLGAFPVDRQKPGLDSLRHSMKILKSDNVLGIFPEGTRVKNFDIDNAKPGVALISIQTQTPIIPIYIDSNYKFFSKIKVNIGKTIEFDQFYQNKPSKEDYKILGEHVLKEIYKLKE